MMSPVEIKAGQRVADCTLVRLLGSGGEGQVWEATRPDGSPCAMKLVLPEVLPAAEEVRDRGRWLVRINHPALVTVTRGGRFTGGDLKDWGFVEMELVEGRSLQQSPPDPKALHHLEGVAEALDYLHAGVWSDGVPLVHRDVKPGNLIATRRGLVLVDPSTLRGVDTRDLTRVGTPAYVAPEVASGHFDTRADVYSFAATAAALLTGLRGSQLREIIDKPIGSGLPPGVVAGLHIDPAQRPEQCSHVLDGTMVVRTQTLREDPGNARNAEVSATRVRSADHYPPTGHDQDFRGDGGHRTGIRDERGLQDYRGLREGQGSWDGQDRQQAGWHDPASAYGEREVSRTRLRPFEPSRSQGMDGVPGYGAVSSDAPGTRVRPGYEDMQPMATAHREMVTPGWGQTAQVQRWAASDYAQPSRRVEVAAHSGQDWEGGARVTPVHEAYGAPLRVWPLLSLLVCLMALAVGWYGIDHPDMQLTEGQFNGIVGGVVAIHLLTHVVNGRPFLGVLLPTYAWGAAMGDSSGTHRWQWVSDVTSGWLTVWAALAGTYLYARTFGGPIHPIIDDIAALDPPRWGWIPVAMIIWLGVLTIRRMGRAFAPIHAIAWVINLPFQLIGGLPRWIFRW